MVRSLEILQIALAFSTVTCEIGRVKKKEFEDKVLWKKEYEDELTDAMLTSKKRDNTTRVQQSAALSDNEAVVERLMDSITSSEKYLKKVDSIDFRLNRLDIEVHEKTNNIMKHLTEIQKALHSNRPDKIQTLLETLKNEMYQIKFHLESNQRTGNGNVHRHFVVVDVLQINYVYLVLTYSPVT